jgi:hypothetical protein
MPPRAYHRRRTTAPVILVARDFSAEIVVGKRRAERKVARQVVDRCASRKRGRQRDGQDSGGPPPDLKYSHSDFPLQALRPEKLFIIAEDGFGMG